MRHQLDLELSAATRFEPRDCASDCQPQLVGRLFGVPEATIDTIVEQGDTDGKANARENREQQQTRGARKSSGQTRERPATRCWETAGRAKKPATAVTTRKAA